MHEALVVSNNTDLDGRFGIADRARASDEKRSVPLFGQPGDIIPGHVMIKLAVDVINLGHATLADGIDPVDELGQAKVRLTFQLRIPQQSGSVFSCV